MTEPRAERDELDRPWPDVTFQVGDRVRVRLSGECKVTHSPESDGRTGVIYHQGKSYPRHLLEAQHRHHVIFDDPFPRDGIGNIVGGGFAAIELELLAAAPTSAAVGVRSGGGER